jgi:hypothetical protein
MRPALTKNIPLESFRDYYWLKAELSAFCRNNQISPSGSKKEIQDRIEHYLKTGIKPGKRNRKNALKSRDKTEESISLEKQIQANYRNDKFHREFFKSIIGKRFKFNVPFMNWMKSNSNKTYQQAVDEWLRIEIEKKAGKKNKIAPQFEYNQYTRDFFSANPSKTRKDAIRCWKYKKSMPGTNTYEISDLAALKKR